MPLTEMEKRIEYSESWLLCKLQEIKQKAVNESMPYAMELSRIKESRHPDPVITSKGIFQYVGPLPTYTPPADIHETPKDRGNL